MRVGIIGAGGQLGRELVQQLGSQAVPFLRADADITHLDSLRSNLVSAKVDAVINGAAYNLVDAAETDVAAAIAVNAIGVHHLAVVCEELGMKLVHVSTDYVFGAEIEHQTPYQETDRPAPVNAYGASKLCGEHLVAMTCSRSFVVRTCGLYGIPPQHGKGNFVETMHRLASQQPVLKVVDDQRCTPTSAKALATAIIALLPTDNYGLYHATCSGDASWFEFASEIVRRLGLTVPVHPVPTSAFPRPARRPGYSVLDGSKLREECGIELPHWREALSEYITGRWGVEKESNDQRRGAL